MREATTIDKECYAKPGRRYNPVHRKTNTMDALISNEKFYAVAEKIQTIGKDVYLQWGMVLALLTLTAFVVEFRVTTDSEIRMLQKADDRFTEVLKEIKSNYPTKDFIEGKFLQLEMKLLLDDKQKKD